MGIVIPAALCDQPRWLCWRLLTRDGKPTKVPFVAAAGMRNAKSNDPTTWRPYADAVRFAPRFDGIGYALGDGWVGIDLDHCRDAATGVVDAWAEDIVELIDSYTEVSPSGTGLHIFCRGGWPAAWSNRRGIVDGKKVGVEVYDSGRYFTVTGETYRERGVEARMDRLVLLASTSFDFAPDARLTARTIREDVSDDGVLARMLGSALGEKITKLWNGDWETDYPSRSDADWDLLDHLLYWTNGDAEQADRLFRRSGLTRPKWDERHSAKGQTYGQVSLFKRLVRWQQKHGVVPERAERAKVAEQEAATGEPRRLRDLMAKTLDAPIHPVPGLFQQGLMVFAGKPKSGKSWLVLNITLAVACGGVALGKIACAQHDVLYLALEDPEWRLQDRVKKVLGEGAEVPEGFYYHTAWRHLDRGGLDDLDTWLGAHPTVRLVVIDVWKRVKPRPQKGENAYDADYEMAAPLKALADKHVCAIVIVHHQNKLQVEDYVDSISGSLGLAAAADGHIVLVRKRGPNSKGKRVFMGTGRDVEEFEWALAWDDALWCYQIVGENEEVQEAGELEETRRLIREAERPVRPGEFATMANITLSAAKVRLWRYAQSGHLRRLGDGTYYISLSLQSPVTGNPVTGPPGQPVTGPVTGGQSQPPPTGYTVTPVTPITENENLSNSSNNSQSATPMWDGHSRRCKACLGWLTGTEERYCRKCISEGRDGLEEA